MRCAILTFHTAHNYGAVLQAYALKHYMESLGYNADFVNFAPSEVNNIYSINPFKRPCGLKRIVKRVICLPKRIVQYAKFNSFIRYELSSGTSCDDQDKYLESSNAADVLICGSDQIWNDNLTGKIGNYYFSGVKEKKKIAYAASFGSRILDDFQRECIKKFLPDFCAVSLREEDGRQTIQELTGIHVNTVMDPVFLIDIATWNALAEKSTLSIKEPYILFYSLKDNELLVQRTEELAKKTNCKLIVVHPIGAKQKIKGHQIYNVGPYEFLRLIRDARYVCTNSFHATAFSILFRKNYLHVRDDSKETRVESLLNRIGGYLTSTRECEFDILKLDKLDSSTLDIAIDESRKFLLNSLEEKR